MQADFIKANLLEMVYTKKEGTTTSYYWQSGAKLLPNRLSISKENEFTKVARKGRNLLHSTIGQMVSSFTKSEVSPLKRYKPFCCRTQIWAMEEYPMFIGYGTIGITAEEGGIKDTSDLVVFYSEDNWQTIKVYCFKGLGKPEFHSQCMSYLNKMIKNELAQRPVHKIGY